MSYKIFVQEPSVHGRRGVFRCEVERPNGGLSIGWGYSPYSACMRAFNDHSQSGYFSPDMFLQNCVNDYLNRDSKTARWVHPAPSFPGKVLV